MLCAFIRRYFRLRMFFPLRLFTPLLLNCVQTQFLFNEDDQNGREEEKKNKRISSLELLGLEIEEWIFCTRNKTKLAFSFFSSLTVPVMMIPGAIWDACSLQIYATCLNFLS